MKIIVHCNPSSGVDYHRLVRPFQLLEQGGMDIVWIDSIQKRKEFDAELTGKYDHGYLEGATHIIGSRFWRYPGVGAIAYMIERMRLRGIKVIIDNDDDWKVPDWNPAFYKYHVVGLSHAIRFSIQEADEVWVTQKKLAHRTKEINRRVRIVPNGICSSDEQWQGHEFPTDQMRFGYIAGSSHYRDLQWSGIDLSGHEGYVVDHVVKITPDQEIEMLSKCKDDNHRRMIAEHIRLLRNATGGKSFAEIMGARHILPFLPVDQYAHSYRDIDVSLIPLRPGKFNEMKSNLKLLEAGFAKKAAIVSNVYPYVEGFKGNYIPVPASTIKSFDWNRVIAGLSHSQAVESAQALHEWVQPFELSRVNEIRKALLTS